VDFERTRPEWEFLLNCFLSNCVGFRDFAGCLDSTDWFGSADSPSFGFADEDAFAAFSASWLTEVVEKEDKDPGTLSCPAGTEMKFEG
jgi:hypothetical protein